MKQLSLVAFLQLILLSCAMWLADILYVFAGQRKDQR